MDNVSIAMSRGDLNGIPQHALPPGYGIRWYRPGDEHAWVRIHELAERLVETSLGVYREQFGQEEGPLAQRQAYLCDARGLPIGTASAWFHDDWEGRPWGRVHWVAIVPDHQGRGLSRALMAEVCNRLVDLGHQRAYLTTSSARRPAIRLYRSFGFEPHIRNEEERRAWDRIQE